LCSILPRSWTHSSSTQLLQRVSRRRRHLVSCRVATWPPRLPLPCLHSPGPTVTIISPKSKLPCLSRTAENRPLAAPAMKSPARRRNPVSVEDRPLSSAAGRLVSAARFLVPREDCPLSSRFQGNLAGIHPRSPAAGLEHVR
jgi:hypothetical protein